MTLDDVNEDVLVVPESWARIIHPRRGAVQGAALRPSSGSAELLEKLYGVIRKRADLAAGHTSTEPDIAEALRQELAGTPSPAGAAAMALLTPNMYQENLGKFVDAWYDARGLAFAAAAMAEMARTSVSEYKHCYVSYHERSFGVQNQIEAARQLRTYLAIADEEQYQEAVRALADHRQTLPQRAAVSYFVPTERDWLDGVCAEFPQARRDISGSDADALARLLVCSIGTAEQLEALGSSPEFPSSNYTDLGVIVTAVHAFNGAVVPLLVEEINDTTMWVSHMRKPSLEVLSHIPRDDAFVALVTRLADKHVPAAGREAARRFPRRAVRLLAEVACRQGANATLARSLLAGHLSVHAELGASVAAGLPEAEKTLVMALIEQSRKRPSAPADQLPELLVSPPWTRPKKRGGVARPVVIEGLTAPTISRMDWKPGEQEEFADDQWGWHELDIAEGLQKMQATGSSGAPGWDRTVLLKAPIEQARPLVGAWHESFSYPHDAFAPILARFGVDALAAILHIEDEGVTITSRQTLLGPVVDLRVARLMADWLARLKSARVTARDWFARHAEDAAVLLIPDALGSDKQLRKAAEVAMRLLAGSPGVDLVEIAENAYGTEAAAAVRSIAETDLLELVPARIPALAPWLVNAMLPQVLLRDRTYALEEGAVGHVLTMLAISKAGEPYAGLEAVKELADPGSLAEFAWALFIEWMQSDYPSKESWILTAQSCFGNDDTVRRLVPLIMAWPGESAHQRAAAGLDTLADIGTDAALMQLHRISEKVKYRALKAKAQEKVARIAAELELTTDQLADRLVPDFGLDAQGRLWLDYGPRRFRVGFDESLRPTVADEAGARRKDLPAANSKDDAELAAASRKQFSALKKDVRAVAADTIRRMEAAMVDRRTWRAGEFQEVILDHPLLGQLAGRVVWLTDQDETFRVAEDRTLADAEDEPFELPEDARVRIAHPMHLGDALAAWSVVFADYEILQPFAQLGRATYSLTEAERAADGLARFEGAKVPVGQVLGLENRGWIRSHPVDGGCQPSISLELTRDRFLIIELNPGIIVGNVYEYGPQTLQEVYLSSYRRQGWSTRSPEGLKLGELDPVTVSEVLGDLTRLVE